MPVGGDIIEVIENHPTLGTYTYDPIAGEDSTYKMGGFVNADESSSIDGKGRAIYKKNRERPSFSVVCAWDMNNNQEMERISQIQESSEEAEYTFTNKNGVVYRLKGQPVGSYEFNGNAASFTLMISGSDKLQIVK